ncbi:MAG: DUF3089 domain-containing protein [Bacteroidales bacterium]
MKSETKIIGRIAYIVFVALILLITSCKKDKEQPANTNAATDYSIAAHWLNIPATAKPVDVFYLYPTAWTPNSPSEPVYCAIDDSSMLKGSAIVFNIQATAFETVGNIYAPYYRQMNAAYAQSKTEEERWKLADSIPVDDVMAAFDYYIQHYNNGRPFILAGHSQGSHVMFFLLARYMKEHPAVYARMIAAYAIGYPLTADFLAANEHLKFAEGPDDTGVIISFNTQSPNVEAGGNIIMTNKIGMVINPVNWKRDTTLAPASESIGSYMPGPGNVFVKVPAMADARVDLSKGVLICSSVDENALFIPSSNMGLGVYHIWDYQFYYYNLRQNAENRANIFLQKKH